MATVVTFTLLAAAFLFFLVGFILMLLERRMVLQTMTSSLSLLLLTTLLLVFSTFIWASQDFRMVFRRLILPGTVLDTLGTVTTLVIVPLIGIFLLVAALLTRQHA